MFEYKPIVLIERFDMPMDIQPATPVKPSHNLGWHSLETCEDKDKLAPKLPNRKRSKEQKTIKTNLKIEIPELNSVLPQTCKSSTSIPERANFNRVIDLVRKNGEKRTAGRLKSRTIRPILTFAKDPPKPEVLLSPTSGRGYTLLSSLPSRKETVEVVDLTKDLEISANTSNIRSLLKIDLCSPLGQRLASAIEENFVSNKPSSIRKYDQYCNQPPEPPDGRTRRSQMAYCEDRWSLNNIHYLRRECHAHTEHQYTFGNRARLDQYLTKKWGLNKRSRKLLTRIQPCSVRIRNLPIGAMCNESDPVIETESPNTSFSSTSEDCSDLQRQIPSKNETPIHILGSMKVHGRLASGDYNSAASIPQIEETKVSVTRKDHTNRPVQRKRTRTKKPDKRRLRTALSSNIDSSSPCKARKKYTAIINQIEGDNLAAYVANEAQSFAWEDLVSDAPKVDRSTPTAPEVIDLTYDEDDPVLTIPLPSPGALLGSEI